jgi:hypothetical protein
MKLYSSFFGNLPSILTNLISEDAGRTYNATAYNTSDDLIYAVETGSNRILQIHADGTIADKGTVGLTGAVLSGAYSMSTGYIVANTVGQIWWIDLTSMQATQQGSLHYADNNGQPAIVDFAFSPVDGRLYAFDQTSKQFSRVGPATGLVTPFGQVHTVNLTGGAAFFDGNGSLYIFGRTSSSTGQDTLYEVDLAPGQQQGSVTIQAQTAMGHRQVDGTTCTPMVSTVFVDDFESGDTSAWSGVVGGPC